MGVIVVGVDGSPRSLAALRWAMEEAGLRAATVRAVYVWSWPYEECEIGHLAGQAAFGRLRHAAEQALDEALRSAGCAQDPAVERRVADGAPARRLIEAADGAELLVVGSRGHGRLPGLVLGSVSRQCARGASCPVVIVRDGASPAHRLPASAA